MAERLSALWHLWARETWQEFKIVSLVFIAIVVPTATLLMTSLSKTGVLWGSVVSTLVLLTLALHGAEGRRNKGQSRPSRPLDAYRHCMSTLFQHRRHGVSEQAAQETPTFRPLVPMHAADTVVVTRVSQTHRQTPVRTSFAPAVRRPDTVRVVRTQLARFAETHAVGKAWDVGMSKSRNIPRAAKPRIEIVQKAARHSDPGRPESMRVPL